MPSGGETATEFDMRKTGYVVLPSWRTLDNRPNLEESPVDVEADSFGLYAALLNHVGQQLISFLW